MHMYYHQLPIRPCVHADSCLDVCLRMWCVCVCVSAACVCVCVFLVLFLDVLISLKVV